MDREAITINLEDDREIATEAASIKEAVSSFRVRSKKDYESAGEYLVSLRLLKKKIKEHYAPMKKQANAARNAILKSEKEQLAPIEEAEKNIQYGLREYRKQVEAAEHERRAKLLKKVRESKGEALVNLDKKEPPEVEGLSFRKKFGWTIEDESKINPEFLTPDRKKIGKVVSSMEKQAEDVVGGIIVIETEVPVVRSK